MRTARYTVFMLVFLMVAGQIAVPSNDVRMVDEEPAYVGSKVVDVMDAQWLQEGIFNGTDMVERNSTLAGMRIISGAILPNITLDMPAQWEFFDDFNTGGGVTPVGWTCGGDIWEASGWVKANPGAYTNGDRNAYCHKGFSASSQIKVDNLTTFHFRMYVEDGYVSNIYGAKLMSILDSHRIYFFVHDDGSGLLTLSSSPDQNGQEVPVNCQSSTVPLGTVSATYLDWEDWRIIVNSSSQMMSLYNDGALRCHLPIPQAPIHPLYSEGMEIGTKGGSGNEGFVNYDYVGAAGGVQKQHGAGDWTSPEIESGNRFWDSISLDWWTPGIGGFSDSVIPRARLSVLNANSMQPYPQFDGIVPVENGTMRSSLDISGLPVGDDIRLKVEWLDVLTDLVSIKDVTISRGVLADPDAVVSYITERSGYAVEGDDVRLRIRFDNIGGVPPTQSVSLLCSLYMDNQLVTSYSFDSSSLNGGHIWDVDVPNQNAGFHNISVTVDVVDALIESDESNNIRNQVIRVHPNQPPQTNLTGSIQELEIGEEFSVSIQDSVSGFTIDQLLIEWGDGNTTVLYGPGPFSVSYVWTQLGIFDLNITGVLEQGFYSTRLNVVVMVGNGPPIAVIDGTPGWSLVGDLASFDCLDSEDWYLDVLTCEWRTSDGQSSTGDRFLPRFNETGLVEVYLNVTDQDGEVNSTSMFWLVTESPASGLVLGILADKPLNGVYEGDRVNITIIQDSSLAYTVDILTFDWKMNGVQIQPIPLRSGVWGLDMPTASGDAQLTVDGWLAGTTSIPRDHDVLTFNVKNRAPVAQISMLTDTFEEDELITVSWGDSTDDEWDLDTLAVYANVEGVQQSIDRGEYGTFTFSRSDAGNFILNVTVRDGDGAESWVELPLNITNRAPTARLNCTTSEIKLDVEIICELLEIDDSPSDVPWLMINWSITDGGAYHSTFRISHMFAATGEQVVTVTLTDNQGETFTANHTVNVSHVEKEESGLFSIGDGDLASAVIWLGMAIVLGAIILGGGIFMLSFSRRGKSEYDEDEYQDELEEEVEETITQPESQPEAQQEQQEPEVTWHQDENGIWWWLDANGDWQQSQR